MGSPEGERPLRRQKRRWEDNIKNYFKQRGWKALKWVSLAQVREKWQSYFNTAMSLQIP